MTPVGSASSSPASRVGDEATLELRHTARTRRRGVNAFDVLGDPVRRRILELLARGERSSGQVVEVIAEELGISQPAVSQHLEVLREDGFATVRPDGTRRRYALDLSGVDEVDRWLADLRAFWDQRLDALATEIARGKRACHSDRR